MPDRFQNNQEIIQQVWEKAIIIEGLDENIYRADHCGAILKRDLYLKNTEPLSMSWEIDRIKPVSHGGTDELSNLQPLQWENNRKKNEDYPAWSCLVHSKDNLNTYV